MSFALKKEDLKKELRAGIFPLVISNIRAYKDSNGKILEYAGGPGVVIQFATADNKIHEELFWINSPEYSRMKKILMQIGLNPTDKLMKSDAIGKRIWAYIRAVITVDADGQPGNEAEYSLFDTSAFITGEKPSHKDDPERNNGAVTGAFVLYNQIESEFAPTAMVEEVIPMPEKIGFSMDGPPPMDLTKDERPPAF